MRERPTEFRVLGKMDGQIGCDFTCSSLRQRHGLYTRVLLVIVYYFV